MKALILGGGVAGLASAAAALEIFDSVVLIDKDELMPSNPEQELEQFDKIKKRRSGVPQYTEPHCLLGGGLDALEKLAPGYTRTLTDGGGIVYDAGTDMKVFDHGDYFARGPTSVTMAAASRRLVNETLYSQVVATAGNRLTVLKAKADGLIFNDTKTQVNGLRISSGEDILADLVIIADGRRSQLPYWLKNAGLETPPIKKVDSHPVYAARWMRLPDDYDLEHDFKTIVSFGRPNHFKTGLAIAAENRLVQVSLVGLQGTKPPKDEAGWLEYAKSLPDPSIYEFIKMCTPVTPITIFAGGSNVLHCYDKIQLPGGLVVLGDAFQAVNPIFGQGMTVAAVSAIVLKDTLNQTLNKVKTEEARKAAVQAPGFSQNFQKTLAKKIFIAWDLATSDDVRYPETEYVGMERPSKSKLKFMEATFVVCQSSIRDWEKLVNVAHMKSPKSDLFSPAFMLKIFKVVCFGKKKKKTRFTVFSRVFTRRKSSNDDGMKSDSAGKQADDLIEGVVAAPRQHVAPSA